MAGIGNYNLKVVLHDTDYYALQALHSYCAWDRRTRVTYMAETLDDLWYHFRTTSEAELPDVVVMDADHINGADGLAGVIGRIREFVARVRIFCLSQQIDPVLIHAAADYGACAFMLKHEVRLQITWAIVHAMAHDFTVTRGIANAVRPSQNARLRGASILPPQREYPEMTDRVRQAIRLCVIEGMPAHLAADEMGISLHTIRGYVKEGYRILEAFDNRDYPVDMTPQERAFMRFTAPMDENI